MKRNKLFFFAGIVLAIVLLAVSVQLIRAQSSNTWLPPSASFPQGNTYPPIDTSENSQAKLGGLILATDPNRINALSFPENRIIRSGNNTLTLNANGRALLYLEDFFDIKTKGLVLPRLGFV